MTNIQQLMNIQQLVKMGQSVQDRINKIQESLESEVLEASAGGGMVTARVTGKGDLTELVIDPAAIDPDDAEMLEDLVIAAVSAAQKKAKGFSEEHMRRAAGQLPTGLSGLF